MTDIRHPKTYRLSDSRFARLKVAAASAGITQQRFIDRALDAALSRAAEDNPLLGLVFEYLPK